MAEGLRIGVDLGGTKIEAAAIDLAGAVELRRRVATPAGDYRATIAAVVALVREIEAALGTRATVGVGMPGAISPASGLVKNANSTWLNGMPLQGDLEAALGRPVRLANDANCFALSEAVDGAAAGLGTVFGVILGTGVGGGIAIAGRILVGANAIAGEWGHNPLPAPRPEDLPGPPCYCGREGCIETYLSGPGFAADHRRHTLERLDPPQIAARAAEGDPASRASLERYALRLARALASVVNLIDPDAIVLGGGMSQIAMLYERVPQLWLGHIFSDAVTTRLLAPRWGAASGVRGAAWLWRPEEAG
jgi:fructokinase